jgi:hypothetical protein
MIFFLFKRTRTRLSISNMYPMSHCRNRDMCNTVTSVFSLTGPGQFTGKDVTGKINLNVDKHHFKRDII